jgi:hypothetical protein
MYKLVILVEPQDDWEAFEQAWPEFLQRAERMPGLIRETSSPVDRLLHGHYHVGFIHELYFESRGAAQAAMTSLEGQEAGKVLQVITGGGVTLLLAEHLEDELANIQSHRSSDPNGPSNDQT